MRILSRHHEATGKLRSRTLAQRVEERGQGSDDSEIGKELRMPTRRGFEGTGADQTPRE